MTNCLYLCCMRVIIIIIIITLFQEDNIFGRVASLTYGPQLTIGMLLGSCALSTKTPEIGKGFRHIKTKFTQRATNTCIQ